MRLLPPDAEHRLWRVRYRDVDTRKQRSESLPAAWSAADREKHAVALWLKLKARQDAIREGRVNPHTTADMPLSEAVESFFRDHTHGIRDRTRVIYRDAAADFLKWAAGAGVKTVRQLNRERLAAYAATVAATPGPHRPRSLETVNKKLRSLAVVLNRLSEIEVLRLTRDDVRYGLRKHKIDARVRKDYLRPDEIQALIAAALRHDASRTSRFEAISTFLGFVLSTGCRLGEALALRWEWIDFHEKRIDLPAAVVKTKRDRTIDLTLCPNVIALLRERGPQASGRVWTECSVGSVAATLKRLRRDPLCPVWSWQKLRVTCATYLACAAFCGPVIESRQLGHSVIVAERSYVGRVRVDMRARTIMQAFGLEAIPQ